MKNLPINKYLKYSILLIIGIFMGWIFFHSSDGSSSTETNGVNTGTEVWTCSMHPQIRLNEPGKCPICGMDLIPLNQSSNAADSDQLAIHLTPEAAQLANVMTSKVTRQKAVKEIRLYGKVQVDERLLQSQTSHIPGRIENLAVNFTGEHVKKGQTLVKLYSPELITAQQELLEAFKTRERQPEIYDAAKEKLRSWKFTDEQISSIVESGSVKNNFDIHSNTSGVIVQRFVNNGDHVSEGTLLYTVADLSSVWVVFDAYESDLLFIQTGDEVNYSLQAIPGKTFSGRISFIDPVIDPITRVAKVRLEMNNSRGQFKPEMFVTGFIQSKLDNFTNGLVIPKSAVLWTGERSIVYIKEPDTMEPIFKMREVLLGPSLGNSYVITGGLKAGEEIVTRGAFSVDAAAQLEGKPSMMNQSIEDQKAKQSQKESPKNMGGHNADASSHTMTQEIIRDSFHVAGNCDMCKERIENAAKSVKGVHSAVWDMKTHIIQVEINQSETNKRTIEKAIAAAGHDTENEKADEKTYAALPECCQYRKLQNE